MRLDVSDRFFRGLSVDGHEVGDDDRRGQGYARLGIRWVSARAHTGRVGGNGN